MKIKKVEELNIEDIIEVATCPHCSSTSIVRNGHKNNKQQYICKKCKKSFQASTGTPTHGLHHTNKIPIYIKALQQGMTIRVAAKYTGISNNTSFNWRHKFISSIKHTPLLANTENSKSITLITTPYNAKGRKKSPEKNRKSSKTLLIQQNGQISIDKLENINTNKQLIELISPLNIISSVKKKELTISTKNLNKNSIISQNQLKNQFLNNITKVENTLSQWMKKFRGVASKYLQQYWNWFAGLSNVKVLNNPQYFFAKLCFESHTLQMYKELRQK